MVYVRHTPSSSVLLQISSQPQSYDPQYYFQQQQVNRDHFQTASHGQGSDPSQELR